MITKALLTAGLVASICTSAPAFAAGSDVRPMDNHPDCQAYARTANHLDPAHNYVCTNKVNNVGSHAECVRKIQAYRPIKYWCYVDKFPWNYDGDAVVITR
ncbi:hypothetical protein DMH04_33740 [Kibdelosporangium aridum]|uniref:Uncharacterized protein n=2 Tax=Kibdelosporangium aridum TaxID=2030 RepID=A0A428Z0T0_KIBAR|nr:hypothetical protein DMH04_33740 [Kibdelosporangium aridum]